MNILHKLRAERAFPACQKLAYAVGMDAVDQLKDSEVIDAIGLLVRVLKIGRQDYRSLDATRRLAAALTAIFQDLSDDDHARLRRELGERLQ